MRHRLNAKLGALVAMVVMSAFTLHSCHKSSQVSPSSQLLSSGLANVCAQHQAAQAAAGASGVTPLLDQSQLNQLRAQHPAGYAAMEHIIGAKNMAHLCQTSPSTP